MSFSLLPDCLASRLPGTLLEIEDVVAKVENSPSQQTAADVIRIDIELPGALRWMRRRIFLVKVALRLLIELLPVFSPIVFPAFCPSDRFSALTMSYLNCGY